MPGGASTMATLDSVPGQKPVSQDDVRVTPAPGAASDAFFRSATSVPQAPGAAPDQKAASTAKPGSTPQAPSGLRITAVLFRAAFIFILIALIIRVSQPQNETIWTAYDTPADLVRLWLGIGACIWLIWQLFEGPRDTHAYRTWFYLGLALVPFSLICLLAVW
jgi:hypothetical protein